MGRCSELVKETGCNLVGIAVVGSSPALPKYTIGNIHTQNRCDNFLIPGEGKVIATLLNSPKSHKERGKKGISLMVERRSYTTDKEVRFFYSLYSLYRPKSNH